MNNVIEPKTRRRRNNVVARYSNIDTSQFVNLGVGGDYSDVTTGNTYTLGSDVSGSGIFNTIINALSGVATSIWGKTDNSAALWQSQYEQEKKTNKLLIGVVIALVVLAFAFLIIKRK